MTQRFALTRINRTGFEWIVQWRDTRDGVVKRFAITDAEHDAFIAPGAGYPLPKPPELNMRQWRNFLKNNSVAVMRRAVFDTVGGDPIPLSVFEDGDGELQVFTSGASGEVDFAPSEWQRNPDSTYTTLTDKVVNGLRVRLENDELVVE